MLSAEKLINRAIDEGADNEEREQEEDSEVTQVLMIRGYGKGVLKMPLLGERVLFEISENEVSESS